MQVYGHQLVKQMFSYFFILYFLYIVHHSHQCTDLVVCALNHCVNSSNYQILHPPKIVPDLFERTDFSCVLGDECFQHCESCGSCSKAFIEEFKEEDSECSVFKGCAQTCIEENKYNPFPCIFQKRCLKYCLDDIKCPACYDLARRLFTGFCHRQQFRQIFNQRCRVLFDTLALDYRLRRS